MLTDPTINTLDSAMHTFSLKKLIHIGITKITQKWRFLWYIVSWNFPLIFLKMLLSESRDPQLPNSFLTRGTRNWTGSRLPKVFLAPKSISILVSFSGVDLDFDLDFSSRSRFRSRFQFSVSFDFHFDFSFGLRSRSRFQFVFRGGFDFDLDFSFQRVVSLFEVRANCNL